MAPVLLPSSALPSQGQKQRLPVWKTFSKRRSETRGRRTMFPQTQVGQQGTPRVAPIICLPRIETPNHKIKRLDNNNNNNHCCTVHVAPP